MIGEMLPRNGGLSWCTSEMWRIDHLNHVGQENGDGTPSSGTLRILNRENDDYPMDLEVPYFQTQDFHHFHPPKKKEGALTPNTEVRTHPGVQPDEKIRKMAENMEI